MPPRVHTNTCHLPKYELSQGPHVCSCTVRAQVCKYTWGTVLLRAIPLETLGARHLSGTLMIAFHAVNPHAAQLMETQPCSKYGLCPGGSACLGSPHPKSSLLLPNSLPPPWETSAVVYGSLQLLVLKAGLWFVCFFPKALKVLLY